MDDRRISDLLERAIDRGEREHGAATSERAVDALTKGRRRRSRARLVSALGAITASAFVIGATTIAWTALTPLGGDLEDNAPGASDPAPTARNGAIVFVCEQEPTDDVVYSTSLCSIAPDGTDPVVLTSQSNIDGQPEWSADGTHLAFIRGDPMYDGDDVGTTIVIIDEAGRESVVPLKKGRHYKSPTWSPDGAAIAYENQGRIFRVGLDGSDPVPVTAEVDSDDDIAAYYPSWSPDGSKIAFSGYVFDPASNSDLQSLYIVEVDGTGALAITAPELMASEPTWSPDGTRLAFTSQANDSIYAVNVDGTGLERLTTAGLLGGPDWSPDGSKILITKLAWGREVSTLVLDLDGGGITRITALGGSATWQPIIQDQPAGP